jgi:predicted acetyltransferase
MTLKLRPFLPTDAREALTGHAELAQEGFILLPHYSLALPWPTYLTTLQNFHHGIALPPGHVPETVLAAVVDQQLVGCAMIRHHLNRHLIRYAGHIGYSVRPAHRRHGYATAMLNQSLNLARQISINPVLVTCNVDNTGSATVIERCGGVLENIVPGRPGIPPKRRYWIEI